MTTGHRSRQVFPSASFWFSHLFGDVTDSLVAFEVALVCHSPKVSELLTEEAWFVTTIHFLTLNCELVYTKVHNQTI